MCMDSALYSEVLCRAEQSIQLVGMCSVNVDREEIWVREKVPGKDGTNMSVCPSLALPPLAAARWHSSWLLHLTVLLLFLFAGWLGMGVSHAHGVSPRCAWGKGSMGTG